MKTHILECNVQIGQYWFPVEYTRKKGKVQISALGDIDRELLTVAVMPTFSEIDEAALQFLQMIPGERKIVTLIPSEVDQVYWKHKQLLVKDLVLLPATLDEQSESQAEDESSDIFSTSNRLFS